MKFNNFKDMLKYIVIVANSVFFIWILFNGVKENFYSSTVEKFSYCCLMILLVLNSYLIIKFSENNHIR